MEIKFGPAGNSESFYEDGLRSALETPKWLNQKGLTAYEYQCGHGVRISDDAAGDLGAEAKKYDVTLSVHAPYYISLSSVEEEKRRRSVDYILQTLRAADRMGAGRIVVHSGSCGKITRREALELAKNTLSEAIKAADENGFGHIRICPETMGKVNQLGNIEEVMELCSIDERLIPTLDFGHINAQSLGKFRTKEQLEYIFDLMENRLGIERASMFHSHYSRIEYTNSGEKKHHTMAETEYEPDFEPIAEIIAERGFHPIMICESAGTQAEDAIKMRDIYRSYLG